MRFASILAVAWLTALTATAPVLATNPATLVRDINPGSGSNPTDLIAVGSRLYFVADDGRHGRELWRTDASSATTTLVADIRPGRSGSNPIALAAADSALFFSANDGTHGRELWRTDGTRGGTRLVKNITRGSSGTEFGQPAGALGSRVYFDANGQSWVTDGTGQGTRRIGPVASLFVPFANRMYFLAGSYSYDQRIWRSDGTSIGTAQMNWSPTEVDELVSADQTLFFLSGSRTPMQNTPPMLWKSDGTKAGTIPLTGGDLDPSYGLVATATQVYFFDENYDPDETAQLWRSNSTVAGTKPLAIVPMPIPTARAINGNLMFFGFSDGGWQLWTSNGTVKGTRQTDSFTGLEPSEMTAVSGYLCFYTYDDNANQWTLWRTDGSVGGAATVANGSPAAQHPVHMAAAGASLYFTLDDGVHGKELWSYTP